jgi:RNA polymerase nonessential primary-like sigma factor
MFTSSTTDISQLSPQEETTLVLKAKGGCLKAKGTLLNANRKLLEDVTSKYHQRNIDRNELVAAATAAFIKAINIHDPSKGALGAYLRQRITDALKESIRFQKRPVNWPANIPICLKCIKKLTQELQREPSRDEILQRCKTCPKGTYLKQILAYPQNLDQPIDYNPDLSLGDTLSDDDNPSPYKALEAKDTYQRLFGHLATLTECQQDVIARYFGLNGMARETYPEIAKTYQCSEKVIRRVCEGAKEKLARRMREDELPKINGNSRPEPSIAKPATSQMKSNCPTKLRGSARKGKTVLEK